ncbi:MAG: 50S ribosomal protein L30 [Heliobacteriaceae bacterium]|nr:50S ribosomal protein L30 [Heliobacteriaceae bacterium]
MAKKLKITWVKSAIGCPENQRLTVATLGLRKLHQTVWHDDTPAIRGMVRKVSHLVKMEEAEA